MAKLGTRSLKQRFKFSDAKFQYICRSSSRCSRALWRHVFAAASANVPSYRSTHSIVAVQQHVNPSDFFGLFLILFIIPDSIYSQSNHAYLLHCSFVHFHTLLIFLRDSQGLLHCFLAIEIGIRRDRSHYMRPRDPILSCAPTSN